MRRGPTRQLANQFEYPVLFFTLASVAIAVPVESAHGLPGWLVLCRPALDPCPDPPDAQLGSIRAPVFMASNIVLPVMWIILGTQVLS